MLREGNREEEMVVRGRFREGVAVYVVRRETEGGKQRGGSKDELNVVVVRAAC